MNKYIASLAVAGVVAVGVLGVAGSVRAMTPTLSLYNSGNSDSVQVTVNGDSNASAYLYYQKSGYGTQSQYLGTTNYNGYLSTTLSTSSLGVSSGSSAYVMVNNQQSSSVSWPYGNYYYGGSITLSPSSITLTVGQNTTITVSGGSQPYVMYPASQNIFQTALSGNTLTITGIAAGSSSLSVCSSGNSGCSTLSITVNNQYNYYNYTGSIYQYPYNYNYNYNYNNQNQGNWTFCANENQWCGFSGNQTVRYGTNGQYVYSTFNGGMNCSNSVFGDPAYGLFKQCWYGGTVAANVAASYSYYANAYMPIYSTGYANFTRTLSYGSYGEDVKTLQRRLTSEDFYNGVISGYFGTMTRAAVRRYQAVHGLSQTGTVNSATIAILNQGALY